MVNIEELRKDTEEGLKQFQVPGLIQVMEGAVETLSELASSTKDPESSQRILSYIGQLQGAIKQAKTNSDEKMMGQFDSVVGHVTSTETSGDSETTERLSEGLAALIKQIRPVLAEAVKIEQVEDKDIEAVEKAEEDVLETLKQGKGKGKRFYKQVDNINRLMKVIKARDDKERKKLQGLLNGKTLAQLRKEYEEAKDNHHGLLGRPRDVNEASLAILNRETKDAEKDMGEKEEIYAIAAKHAKGILNLRVNRLDRVLRRVSWLEDLFNDNNASMAKLNMENKKLKGYAEKLSGYMVAIQQGVHALEQHPKFTDKLKEIWEDFKDDDSYKEEGIETAEAAVSHITNFIEHIGVTLQNWKTTQDILMNDQAKLGNMIAGLKAKLADSITGAKEMLEDNAEIKIIDLPIAGSDDPVLKNFNQAVFNMRDHVSPVAEAVKKFILYSTVLKTSIFFINTVITVLSEDIEEEPAPTEPVQEAA